MKNQHQVNTEVKDPSSPKRIKVKKLLVRRNIRNESLERLKKLKILSPYGLDQLDTPKPRANPHKLYDNVNILRHMPKSNEKKVKIIGGLAKK